MFLFRLAIMFFMFLFCLAIMFFMRGFLSLIDPVAMLFLSRAVLHDAIGVWLSAIILKLLFLRILESFKSVKNIVINQKFLSSCELFMV